MYVTQSAVVLETDEHDVGSDFHQFPEGGLALQQVGEEKIIPFRKRVGSAASENICWVEGTVSVTF